MTVVISAWPRWSAVLLLAALNACSSLSADGPGPALAGHWLLDSSASGDANALVTRAVADAQTKFRQRRARAGYGPAPGDRPGGGTGGPGGDDDGGLGEGPPGDEFGPGPLGPDFGQLRARLREGLESPAALTISVDDGGVRLQSDALPPRDYRPGEDSSRIDEYGAARIQTGWNGGAFEIRAKYSGSGERVERYLAQGPMLTVTHELTDRTAGKLQLVSVYRRE